MIETARLTLRLPRPDDLDTLAAMAADPAIARFVGGRPETREEAWGRLLRYAGMWPVLGFGLFAVEEKAGGRFVGHVGLGRFERGLGPDFDPHPEAAWALAVPAQGMGYATEAGLAALRWFEASRGPTRTVAIIDPLNAASLRVAAKLGYRPAGEAPYRDRPVVILARPPGGLPEGPGAP